MSESYWVTISKDQFTFSAAHFITYDGDVCERLHGHNYRVSAEFHAPLDENHYVVDFIALRDTLQAIVAELDHHMLLPTTHPLLRVEQSRNEVAVSFGDRRWVFPSGDCVLLPVPNTTTELLARFIGQELLNRLEDSWNHEPNSLRIGVDENNGQWGFWEKRNG